jgi:predicted nuclease of predicted toxin-antitoxin system
MEEIGGRVAVVDACLPPQLADDLRERGASAIWVPAIMGDGVSDEEIDRQLLISDWQLSYFKSKRRVLLTKDVEFYKKIRNRAILVRRHHLAPEAALESRLNSKLRRSDLRKLSESRDNS